MLETGGQDATQAKTLLRSFEDVQAMHVAERDRLLTAIQSN